MKFFIILFFSILVSLSVNAKTIDQKKEELKKIYEAGGISKIEYEKSIDFLEKSDEKIQKNPKKKIFSIKNKKNENNKKL